MWALIVANQDTPVHVAIARSQVELDSELARIKREWQLLHAQDVHLLEAPPALPGQGQDFPAILPLKRVVTWVDSTQRPRYRLTIVRVKTAKKLKSNEAPYKFCPQCGCSWLQHLEGSAQLEPQDWEPCACADCGCLEALHHE